MGKVEESKMARRILIPVCTGAILMCLIGATIAYQAWGWGEIRADLLDGDGAEFIVDQTYMPFPGATEIEKVLAAANWVASNMEYTFDPDPPGDVWTSSDETYDDIIANGIAYGDCEDFSILLCALMRFSVGVPADRVWVQGGLIAAPGSAPENAPPLVGHAYVVYKAERGGIWYIEPQWGEQPYAMYRGSTPSVSHWYMTPPYIMGESAMLRFNDEWVKGGGPYLAGPRN